MSLNKANNTTTVASVVATTTTTLLSSITSTIEPTVSATQNTVSSTPTQNAVSPVPTQAATGSQSNSRLFPILCVVCGLCFIAAIFFYIYATRNKNDDVDDSKIMKRSVNHSSGGNSINSGRFDIRVDRQYSKGSGFNNSMDHSYGFSLSEDRSMNINNAQSPYSDANTLVNSSIVDYNGSIKSKKGQNHYPNPLFEHSRPVNRTPTVIRANERDITEESVNLNILTQEEIQLLRMKQINNRNNRNNINMNEQLHNMNGKGKSPVINSGINDISPNMNVAPFNYMNSKSPNPSELFRRESEESSHSYAQNLGQNIRIETKKIEYIQQDQEDPINKYRIKRMNK